MSTKMWKHEGKWRFMATLGKTHRAVLQVPFDADEAEAQAIVDAEVEATAVAPATYHPWEVKEEKKPKAAVVEWEYGAYGRGGLKSEAVRLTTPETPPGDGWELLSTSLLSHASGDFYLFWQWRRPKP